MEKVLKLLLMDRHELGNPKIVTTEMFNEAIAELEEAMKPKTCDGCKHRVFHCYDSFKKIQIDKCNIREQLHFNGKCDGFYCNMYEPKG